MVVDHDVSALCGRMWRGSDAGRDVALLVALLGSLGRPEQRTITFHRRRSVNWNGTSRKIRMSQASLSSLVLPVFVAWPDERVEWPGPSWAAEWPDATVLPAALR
jgi:hypothetical protein